MCCVLCDEWHVGLGSGERGGWFGQPGSPTYRLLHDLQNEREALQVVVEAVVVVLEHQLAQARLGVRRQLHAMLLRELNDRGDARGAVQVHVL